MLDKRTAFLLNELNKICADSSYKVIEIQELCSNMPKKYKIDDEIFSQIIQHLVERNYISVKYFDDSVYCLSVLPKGRLFREKDHELNLAKNKKFEIAWIALICGAVGAFFGSAVATIIILLII